LRVQIQVQRVKKGGRSLTGYVDGDYEKTESHGKQSLTGKKREETVETWRLKQKEETRATEISVVHL